MYLLTLAYLRNLDDHGLKHEVIYPDIILNQSSGNCTTNNGRNNETKDHNLIYAIDCIIRISFSVPISDLNNIIKFKILSKYFIKNNMATKIGK